MSSSDGASFPPPGDPAMGGPAPVFQLATWVQRFMATLIDGGITFAIYFVGFVLNGFKGGAIASLFWLIAIAFSFWQLWNQGEKGYTIGKKVVGLRVLWEANGQLLGGGMSIVRGLAHILDAIPCYIGFLWPLWDAKRQTFADKVMKTVVVAD